MELQAQSAPAEESAREDTRASGPAGVRGATSGPLITEGFESESFVRLRAAFAGGPATAPHPLFMPLSSSHLRPSAPIRPSCSDFSRSNDKSKETLKRVSSYITFAFFELQPQTVVFGYIPKRIAGQGGGSRDACVLCSVSKKGSVVPERRSHSWGSGRYRAGPSRACGGALAQALVLLAGRQASASCC